MVKEDISTNFLKQAPIFFTICLVIGFLFDVFSVVFSDEPYHSSVIDGHEEQCLRDIGYLGVFLAKRVFEVLSFSTKVTITDLVMTRLIGIDPDTI